MNRLIILTAVLIFSAAAHLSAEMVRYVDEFGKPHYVNTDYSTVPEQYRHQVEAQLKALEEKKTPAVPMMPVPAAAPMPAEPAQPAPKETLPVTLFITQDCPKCLVLGMLLRKEGINVITVDINTPDGKERYAELKTAAIPVAIVGDEVITEFDPSRIFALAQGKESPKN